VVPVGEQQRLLRPAYVALEVVSDHVHQMRRDHDIPHPSARLRPVVPNQSFGRHDAAADVHYAVDGIQVLAAELQDLSVPQRTPGAQLDGESQ
jgi:hypothetical protein